MPKRINDAAILDAVGATAPERGQVQAIAARLGVTTATVRRHLHRLATAGLVTVERRRTFDPQSGNHSHAFFGGAGVVVRHYLIASIPSEPRGDREVQWLGGEPPAALAGLRYAGPDPLRVLVAGYGRRTARALRLVSDGGVPALFGRVRLDGADRWVHLAADNRWHVAQGGLPGGEVARGVEVVFDREEEVKDNA